MRELIGFWSGCVLIVVVMGCGRERPQRPMDWCEIEEQPKCFRDSDGHVTRCVYCVYSTCGGISCDWDTAL